MRAVVATRPGPPSVLEIAELPDPELAGGHVLVNVEVAGVTFIDTQLRAGGGPLPLPADAFPLVLGNGVAGTVVAVGADVDRRWLDVRAVATTGGSGGYASRATAAAGDLHRIPAGLDTHHAVALLADGRTALGLTRSATVRGGDIVAVTAAGGGVGSLLVQLAQTNGARVIALASSRAKLDRAVELGAGHTLSYRQPGWERMLQDIAPALDVVFDGNGGEMTVQLLRHLADGGRYVQHGAASGAWSAIDADVLRARGARVVTLADVAATAQERYQLIEDALALGAAGKLVPSIGQVVPLERAAAAHAAMEARDVVGKTLLVP